jgi:hypothetical protein
MQFPVSQHGLGLRPTSSPVKVAALGAILGNPRVATAVSGSRTQTERETVEAIASAVAEGVIFPRAQNATPEAILLSLAAPRPSAAVRSGRSLRQSGEARNPALARESSWDGHLQGYLTDSLEAGLLARLKQGMTVKDQVRFSSAITPNARDWLLVLPTKEELQAPRPLWTHFVRDWWGHSHFDGGEPVSCPYCDAQWFPEHIQCCKHLVWRHDGMGQMRAKIAREVNAVVSAGPSDIVTDCKAHPRQRVDFLIKAGTLDPILVDDTFVHPTAPTYVNQPPGAPLASVVRAKHAKHGPALQSRAPHLRFLAAGMDTFGRWSNDAREVMVYIANGVFHPGIRDWGDERKDFLVQAFARMSFKLRLLNAEIAFCFVRDVARRAALGRPIRARD